MACRWINYAGGRRRATNRLHVGINSRVGCGRVTELDRARRGHAWSRPSNRATPGCWSEGRRKCGDVENKQRKNRKMRKMGEYGDWVCRYLVVSGTVCVHACVRACAFVCACNVCVCNECVLSGRVHAQFDISEAVNLTFYLPVMET